MKSAARTAKAAKSRAAHTRPKRRNNTTAVQRPRGIRRPSAGILIAAMAMALIPLIVAPSASDPFRLPKTLLFQATGLLLLGGMVIGTLLRGGTGWRTLLHDRVNQLLVAIVAWAALATIVSATPLVSLYALLTVVSGAAFFVTMRQAGRTWQTGALWFLFLPALVNAAIVLLQELKIWNPLIESALRARHEATTGLLGNPNDAGSFLAPVVIAAAAAALAARRWQRFVISVLVFAACAVALILTQTRAAIGATTVGLVMIAMLMWRRRALLVATAVLILAVLAAASYRPLLNRLQGRISLATFASGRMVAFAAAADMVRQRPFFGVGPGGFANHFFDYSSALMHAHPSLVPAGPHANFGEVHNDHLQIAAETGLPGYILFLAALIALSRRSRSTRRGSETESTAIGRLVALPLAATLATLALFQFPLQITAPTMAFLFTAGLSVGWTDG